MNTSHDGTPCYPGPCGEKGPDRFAATPRDGLIARIGVLEERVKDWRKMGDRYRKLWSVERRLREGLEQEHEFWRAAEGDDMWQKADTVRARNAELELERDAALAEAAAFRDATRICTLRCWSSVPPSAAEGSEEKGDG